MRKLLLLFGLTGLIFTSCQKETISPDPKKEEEKEEEVELVSTLDYIKTDENFSTLYDAILYANMEATLQQEKSFTFFAPDNDAFQKFMDKQGWNSINDASINQLEAILKFHISDQGMVESTTFTNGQEVPILYNDKKVSINMDDPEKTKVVLGLTHAIIIKKDIKATNGILHKIDDVLTL